MYELPSYKKFNDKYKQISLENNLFTYNYSKLHQFTQ